MAKRLTSVDRASPSQWALWILVALIVASFAVRLHDLEAKSLWSDEGLTLRRAEQPLGLVFKNVNLIPTAPDYHQAPAWKAGDLQEGNGVVATPDLHPPLYFLLMHGWIRVAGESEFALRFPSVMAATLTLPLLYVLARRLMSREAGLWAALLAAVSPFYLWHAQEARMYTWLVVWGLASVYALLPLLEDAPRPRHYAAYIAATSALLYTHYAGFLLLALEVVAYATYRLRTRPREALVVLGLLAVALVPLAPYAWRTLEMRSPFGFIPRSLPVILTEAWHSFSLGPSPSPIRPWWQAVPFLVLAGVGALMLDVPRRRRAWVICLGYLTVPVLLQYIASFFKPNYMNPRHLMVVSPAWELLMAQGLATLRRRFWPGLAILLGLVLLFRGQMTDAIFTSHRLWKDDIRGAVRYIEARARPGDAIVLHHPVIRLTFDYYYDGPYPEIAIPRYGNNDDTEQALATFADWAQRYDRIWFLSGPPPTYFPHDVLPDWADAHLFKVCQRGFEAWWTYVRVAAYDDAPPLLDALPTEAEPREISWGGLRLIGFRAPEAAAGEDTWLDLYWQAGGEGPDTPLELKVSLRDQAGAVWHERTERTLRFYPPSAWPTDRIVHTEFRLPIPDDMPPITYTVDVEPIGLGEAQNVGQMRVMRPKARGPVPRPRARFENDIELLDSELGSDRFRAGYPLFGSLTWRADTATAADCRLQVRLTDLWGREITREEMAPSAAGFPTSVWRPGDQVAGRLFLPLPIDLKGGRYRVQVGLVDAADGSTVPVRRWYGRCNWVTVGTVQVEAWPLVTELPDEVDHRLEDTRLAEIIRLRGYDLTQEEDALRVTLYWQAEKPPSDYYHVFVHLGTPGQPPIAQAGGVPGGWARPTTTWRVNEIIADTHTISLAEVPSGQYSLIVGLFDPGTGRRPRTVVDGDVVPDGYVELQGIEIRE